MVIERPASDVPPWELRWPGRLAAELSALSAAGAQPVRVSGAWRPSEVVVDVRWPHGEIKYPLRIVYPDAFPYTKPEIFLQTQPETWPARHCNPTEGNLCLLGRNTRQWQPLWTAAQLLSSQFPALLEGGEEDPQGEPAEYWWNALSMPNEHADVSCFFSSDWQLGEAEGGSLKLRYAARAKPQLQFRAAVEAVLDRSGTRIGDGVAAPAGLTDQTTIPWVRLDQTLMPKLKSSLPTQLSDLLQHPALKNLRPTKLNLTFQAMIAAFAFPMETTSREQDGVGWLLLVKPVKGGGASSSQPIYIARTQRSGPSDLSGRSPDAALLSQRTIALYGLGAIGAPLAIELARNGIGRLRLREFDFVEPGNSVRWPLGVPAWGLPKGTAVADFIEANYPGVDVEVSSQYIGSAGSDDEALTAAALSGCDLVINATANYSAGAFLADAARRRGVPLISVYGTSAAQGGVVAAFAPDGACPICLQHAWESIGYPEADDEGLIQPAGCGERTFTGSSFDLQEMSLQAARMAADWSPHDVGSVVSYVMIDRSAFGVRVPRWNVAAIPIHQGCTCQSSR